MLPSTSLPTAKPARHYDLDWLRVFATLAVFLFHSARAFDFGDWHIKNAALDAGLNLWTGFLGLWIMPLMFTLSGVSIALSLRNRSGGTFLRDRVTRLLIPLIFGVLVLIPPQVYLERLTRQMFSGSFLDFYPHYFDGLYLGIGVGGNFAWIGLHLWYLLVLFLLSVLLLPLFLWLRRDRPQQWLKRIGSWLEKPGIIFLPALPLMLISAALDPRGIGLRDLGGWNIFVYLTLLIYGFVIAAAVRTEQTFYRYRYAAFGVGLIAALMAERLSGSPYGTGDYFIERLLSTFSSWCLIITLLGIFWLLRNHNTPFLSYTSEMVLPFYMLHQTVIVIIGYYILQNSLQPVIKYGLIIVICFPIVIGLYEFIVRRFNLLRFLFGLKPLARNDQPVSAALAGGSGGRLQRR